MNAQYRSALEDEQNCPLDPRAAVWALLDERNRLAGLLDWLGEMGRVTHEAWLRRVHPEHVIDGQEWEALVRPMSHSVFGRTPVEAMEKCQRALEPRPA